MPKTVVAGSVDVVKESKGANSVVVRAAVVIDERVGSNGSVECASGVEQQRCSANCGIGIRGVEDQRPSTNTGVEVVRRSGKERIPTNSCVSSAGRKESEGVAPFRCREPGIAPVRWRADRLRYWQKPNAPNQN